MEGRWSTNYPSDEIYLKVLKISFISINYYLVNKEKS